MRFTLEIRCGNAAFGDYDGNPDDDARNNEVARILREAAAGIANGRESLSLRDINGNTVGKARFVDDESESTARHTACVHCGHDIEGDTADPSGDWRDRGNGTECLPYVAYPSGETITPPAGQRHEPML